MPGLVEGYAQLKGMALGRFTVIVEGTTDVAVLADARRLYNEAKVIDLYADGFAVVAAGMGDDGGVDDVNRELPTLRNLARSADPASKKWTGLCRHPLGLGRRTIAESGVKAAGIVEAFYVPEQITTSSIVCRVDLVVDALDLERVE